jgi:hypothetical protein
MEASNVGGPIGGCLVDDSDGTRALVMEFVDGEVLDEMLTGTRAVSGEDLPETLTARSHARA